MEAECEDNASDYSLTLDMSFVTDLNERDREMTAPVQLLSDSRVTPPLSPWDSILEGDMLVSFCQ